MNDGTTTRWRKLWDLLAFLCGLFSSEFPSVVFAWYSIIIDDPAPENEMCLHCKVLRQMLILKHDCHDHMLHSLSMLGSFSAWGRNRFLIPFIVVFTLIISVLFRINGSATSNPVSRESMRSSTDSPRNVCWQMLPYFWCSCPVRSIALLPNVGFMSHLFQTLAFDNSSAWVIALPNDGIC